MIRSKDDNKKTFVVIRWIFVVLSFSLIIWLSKLLTVDRETIEANQYNPISEEKSITVMRGSIYAADGTPLAYTEVGEDGEEVRKYPYHEAMSHVVGYTGRGRSGLEDTENDVLLTPVSLTDQLISWANEEKAAGQSIVTTLDADLAEYIYEQMNGSNGAVIVTDPSTGKILAMVSTPSFDPETISEDWDRIAADESSPLYARATMGLYPPGSTFKIITALAMYRNFAGLRSFTYDCYGELDVDGIIIACHNHTAHGTVGIEDAFAYSCNGFFGTAGIEMGARVLKETTSYVKLGNDFGFELGKNDSVLLLDETDADSMVAQTAMGQGETLVTPFDMNMLTCAIANGGIIYSPYLVDRVVDTEMQVIDQKLPTLWGSVMTSSEAEFLEELMAGVTSYGTASLLSGNGYDVYGKTGTAQVEDGDSHSWFTGYVKQDGQAVLAITVLVENGANDNPAVPLTNRILNYYFN